MEKTKLEEYKQKHGKIFAGKYSFTDYKNESQTLDYHFRKPTLSDIEQFQDTVIKNASAANRNMFAALVVDQEERQVILDAENEFPGVISKIVDGFLPFFGANGKVEITEV